MEPAIEEPTPPTAVTPPTPTPTPQQQQAARRSVRGAPRRTRVVVRKVGPWSVLKFSLLFYFCVMLIVYFALMIIYSILSAVGAIDSLGRLLGYVFATGNDNGPQAVVIRFGSVFSWLFLIGLANVVLWSLINVFVAFLYNLISDVVGGVEVTLAEKR
jgi:Transmembrane domain of unknown function (DUF3566)